MAGNLYIDGPGAVSESDGAREAIFAEVATIGPHTRKDVLMLNEHAPVVGPCARGLSPKTEGFGDLVRMATHAEVIYPHTSGRGEVHKDFRCVMCGRPVKGHPR